MTAIEAMTTHSTFTPPSIAPLWGEARYGIELARLVTDASFRAPARRGDGQPVLLIPGFMAGDGSLVVMRRWLERRGHRVAMSGMRANVDCAERAVTRLGAHLRAFAAEAARPVFLIGQSRGGSLARALAVRNPRDVSGLVMLGAPIRDPLAVSPTVLGAVRSLARLGDLGLPGVFSSTCRDGACCAAFRRDLSAPLPADIRVVAIYSRSDAVVDWRACLDPHAEPVEVGSSHAGMSVNGEVYRVLERALDGRKELAWSG
jgi:pimeloyl-ACP methyl ester carboxylesterase